jgi:hypothetical protein
MITIDHTIKEPSSLGFLYSPTDECLGEIENELQLYDVQIQICKQNLDGYYIVWHGHTINVDHDGNLSEWPENYCDQSQGAFVELHRIRLEKKGMKDPIPDSAFRNWRHTESA